MESIYKPVAATVLLWRIITPCILGITPFAEYRTIAAANNKFTVIYSNEVNLKYLHVYKSTWAR